MSNKQSDDSLVEKNLLTLEQLTQTIEVMSGVVDKLKLHLSQQLRQDSSNSHEKVALTKELLKNENTLNELQKIASRQHETLKAVKFDSRVPSKVRQEPQNSLSDHLDADDIDEITQTFVIEISRGDEDAESDGERVLH